VVALACGCEEPADQPASEPSAMALIHRKLRVVGASPVDEEPSEDRDSTRLEHEWQALREFQIQLLDYRHLEPQDVCTLFAEEQRSGKTGALRLLSIAIFTGTAQACMKGNYWAPSASTPGAVQVDCQHLTRPVSRLHLLDKSPPPGALKPRGPPDATPRITCAVNCHPLDMAARMVSRTGSRIAVVRYSSDKDPRNEPPITSPANTQARSARYTHLREDQIFTRTSYWQAFERMTSDLNATVTDSLDMGGLIYTPGVGVLRGPIEEGAIWYQDPPRVDVLWVSLPPRLELTEQEQYAHERDRNATVRVVDRIFLWAAANEVDVLIMPPLGCGAMGCQHPRLDIGDIINRAAFRYAQYIPHVCVTSDWPEHSDPGWWQGFADAVHNGRPAIAKCPVPVTVPPYPKPRVCKDTASLVDQRPKRISRSKPRSARKTYL